MLVNVRIGTKLIGGFAAVVLLITAMVATSAVSLSTLMDMQDSGAEIGTSALRTERARSAPSRLYMVIADAEINRHLSETHTDWEAASKEWADLQRELASVAADAQEKQWLATGVSEIKAGVAIFENQMLPVLALPRSAESDARLYDMDEAIDTRFAAAEVPLRAWAMALEKRARQSDESFDARARGTRTLIIVLGVCAAILAFAIGVLLTRSITEPLSRGVAMMRELSRGRLGARLRLDRADELGQLSHSMDTFADELQGVVGTMHRISQGDLSTEIVVADDADEISPALRDTIGAIRALVAEVQQLSEAGRQGRLHTRGDAKRFSGGYRDIVVGINDTLDAVLMPVSEASAVLQRVAARDLSVRMQGAYHGDLDALKVALNATVTNLAEALTEVRGSAEAVAAASQQIASGSESLAQATSVQASTIEEVSAGLKEVASQSEQSAMLAGDAHAVATEAHRSVQNGIATMDRLSGAMQEIKNRSDDTARIVKTIDEIAFQTNLLALNAAVEAARAGDSGRGFAVVADEVRSLAIRSAEAAKTTAALIDEAVRATSLGVTLNGEALSALRAIGSQVDRIAEKSSEIAAASKQQHEGVAHIARAIDDVSHATQSAAANAEESASASEELSASGAHMLGIVDGFALTGTAASHRAGEAGVVASHDVASGRRTRYRAMAPA